MRLELRQLDLMWREIEGQVVALDSRTWEYLSVNGSGRLLWGQLAEGATADELVASLRETYDVSEENARADVGSFVEMLRDKELLAE